MAVGAVAVNNRGFSLVEIMVGLFIATGLVALTGGAIYSTKKSEVMLVSRASVDHEHIIALQRLQKSETLKTGLNLNTSQAQSCLGRKGTGCTTLGPSSYTAVSVASFGITNSDQYEHHVTYKMNCTEKRCQDVQLLLRTSPLKVQGRERQSEIVIPAGAFFGREQISFSCLSGTQKLLHSINYDDLEARCMALPATTNCSPENPLRSYGSSSASCQTMTTQNCGARGVGRAGLYQGQSGCSVTAY